MASAINPNFPVYGTPTTVSVRNNFASAASEISALQATAVTGGPYLPLIGGTLSNGLGFGSANVASAADLSRHISLFTGYGFSITSGRLNFVAPTAGSIVTTIGGADRLTINNTGVTATVPIISTSSIKGSMVQETVVAMAASNIDCNAGAFFTKTITGTTAFTVSNIPVANTVPSFVLELTNAGAFAVSWWSGITWPLGTVPTLTPAGIDVLAFYTTNGGTIWRGMLLGRSFA